MLIAPRGVCVRCVRVCVPVRSRGRGDAQWNRVVLLHGPPGTGKTSLCRGLAHKLAIRLSSVYAQGHLVEVNAHSLFSKWFSESGKMVMAMFARIRELLDDGDSFVCVVPEPNAASICHR